MHKIRYSTVHGSRPPMAKDPLPPTFFKHPTPTFFSFIFIFIFFILAINLLLGFVLMPAAAIGAMSREWLVLAYLPHHHHLSSGFFPRSPSVVGQRLLYCCSCCNFFIIIIIIIIIRCYFYLHTYI